MFLQRAPKCPSCWLRRRKTKAAFITVDTSKTREASWPALPFPPTTGSYLFTAKSELGAKGKAAEAVVKLRMGGRASYHFALQGTSRGARARSSANFVTEAEREPERQWHSCGVVLGPRDGWKAGRPERTETGKQAPDRLSPLLIACW